MILDDKKNGAAKPVLHLKQFALNLAETVRQRRSADQP